MSEIPEDDVALPRPAVMFADHSYPAYSRAQMVGVILAERERCAQVAHEKLASWRLHKSAAFVAKAIRNPHSLPETPPQAADSPAPSPPGASGTNPAGEL